MDNKVLNEYFKRSGILIKSLQKEQKQIDKFAKEIKNTILNKKKLLVAGNGGSSSDADHFVGELVCTYKNRERKGFQAISLSSNSASITAWANDFGYDTVFSRQVSSLGKKGDILLLLSTSGGNIKNNQSMNLVNAAKQAKKMGVRVISLLGKDGGELKKISNKSIIIKSSITSHIQEAHIAILHYICETMELIK
jgi:D-sedoheptulose 7-phosphate isomerase